MLTSREVFHLCFLERLLRVSDPTLYVLKGGVNLRFFFHSPRYSEDMDIDVVAGNVTTLKKNGYKILNDPSFGRLLKTYNIADLVMNDPLKAKQTETTQRFRLSLIMNSGERLPTKVEFSRRKGAKDYVTEQVDPEIARTYYRLAFRCQHYPGEVMVKQKILALAGRNVTQARDLFDLAILQAGGFWNSDQVVRQIPKEVLLKAEERVFALSVSDFEGQVIEYLDDSHKKEYEGKTAWRALKDDVAKRLGDVR